MNKLLLLQSRESIKEAASLISCGPSDKIHFWAVYTKRNMFASFQSVSLYPLFCISEKKKNVKIENIFFTFHGRFSNFTLKLNTRY